MIALAVEGIDVFNSAGRSIWAREKRSRKSLEERESDTNSRY